MAQQGFSSSLPGWRDGCERAQPGVAHAVGHDAPLRGPAACIAVPMVRGPRWRSARLGIARPAPAHHPRAYSCRRCTAAPSLETEAEYELVGDPGKVRLRFTRNHWLKAPHPQAPHTPPRRLSHRPGRHRKTGRSGCAAC